MDDRHAYEHAQCDYFSSGACSSCSLLAIAPGGRLRAKEELISATLAKHAIHPQSVEPMVLPSNAWGSRSKIKMSVTGSIDAPCIGIVRSDLTSVDLTACPLTPCRLQSFLAGMKPLLREISLPPYDIQTRRGELKHIHIVGNHDGSEAIVRFILRSSESIPRLRKVVPKIQNQYPWISVVSCNIQPIHAAIQEGPTEEILTERRSIEVQYNNVPLSLLPQSFMQVTHEIAEALYRRVATYVGKRSFQHALDLYCGVGGFSLSCAQSVGEITGVEVSEMAIESARASAKRLGFANAVFHVADVEDFLSHGGYRAPDVVIVNPPRRGLSSEIRQKLLSIRPKTIVYSSCDLETFARDARDFVELYQLTTLAPFDMFPMTNHCEVLGFFER